MAGIDPATRYVRSLPGNYFMLKEAAEMVGVSQYVLRKLIQDEDAGEAKAEGLTPSKYAPMGNNKIYLYTREDIDRLTAHFSDRKRVVDIDGPINRGGRPPIYTRAERKERNRLHSQAWYYQKREEKLRAEGNHAEADKAAERYREISDQLKGITGVRQS